MCKILQASLKVFDKLFKLVFHHETNMITTTSESFINNQLISVIEKDIFCMSQNLKKIFSQMVKFPTLNF